MAIHDNMLVLPTADDLEVLVASVMETPEGKLLGEIDQLRAQYEDELRIGKELFLANAELEKQCKAAITDGKQAQKTHDALSEKMRANENRIFSLLMDHPDIATRRAKEKDALESNVRAESLTWLRSQAGYQQWESELASLQADIVRFGKLAEKLARAHVKGEKQAQAKSQSARALREQIEALEAQLYKPVATSVTPNEG